MGSELCLLMELEHPVKPRPGKYIEPKSCAKVPASFPFDVHAVHMSLDQDTCTTIITNGNLCASYISRTYRCGRVLALVHS